MHDKFDCPIMATMAMISDKWKVLIICKLRNGKMRFNELMRALQGVTQRVLTHQLRELESDGLVSRKIYPEVPPRVEYSLTHLGETLIPVLGQLEDWAKQHSSEILNARRTAIKNAAGNCTAAEDEEIPSKVKEKADRPKIAKR